MSEYYRLDTELWRRANMLYNKARDKGEQLGRRKLAELLSISEGLARELLFAIVNRDVLHIDVREHLIDQAQTELIISDLHIPYHDVSAISAVFDYLDSEHIKPDIITILGDLIDFYQISAFHKDPTRKNVKIELDEAAQFLTWLRNEYPDAKIYYYQGNHEERLNRYIVRNAKEIYELVDNLIEDKLDLKLLNIEYITEPFKIGKLWHLHGHERPSNTNPEYITNVMWKYIHDNFIVGHYHRNQEKVFKNIGGQLFWGGAVGHLATVLDYAILNNWNQGFCVVQYDSKGNFKANLRTINEGQVL